jgi:GT2 family glycosyltransferase
MNLYTLPDKSMRGRDKSASMEVSDVAPARIMEIELGEPLPVIAAFDAEKGKCYQRVLCLVRLHTRPLGVVEFTLEGDAGGAEPEENTGGAEPPPLLDAGTCAAQIWSVLREQINEHLRQDGLAPVAVLEAGGLPAAAVSLCIEEREQFLANAPFVSVIVPTHDRPDLVQATLRSLAALHYPRYEVIIVDNAPTSEATADFIQQTYGDMPRIRYLREDRPGVSWARNRGIEAAKGKILAFTDDDVVVDRYWLAELIRPFGQTENVACVTGQVLPLELETPAQFWYERYGGSYWFLWKGRSSWWSGRHIFDLKQHRLPDPLYPYRAGQFGCGASMACTADFLRKVGGFDPALGGNGPSRCAQDIAVLFQVVARGYTLVYEPTSVVYHLNRREYRALSRQIYNYGIGMTAYLTRSLLHNPRLLFDFLPKAALAFIRLLMGKSTKHDEPVASYPRELTILKLKGMLYGPLAYFQSWMMARKLRDKRDQSSSDGRAQSAPTEGRWYGE